MSADGMPKNPMIARVAQRLAPGVLLGTGFPPVPLRWEVAERLAEAVNTDPEIRVADERVTPEEMMPVLVAVRRRHAEEAEATVRELDRRARELEDEFGRPWDER